VDFATLRPLHRSSRQARFHPRPCTLLSQHQHRKVPNTEETSLLYRVRRLVLAPISQSQETFAYMRHSKRFALHLPRHIIDFALLSRHTGCFTRSCRVHWCGPSVSRKVLVLSLTSSSRLAPPSGSTLAKHLVTTRPSILPLPAAHTNISLYTSSLWRPASLCLARFACSQHPSYTSSFGQLVFTSTLPFPAASAP
jgi:hypothetical protein